MTPTAPAPVIGAIGDLVEDVVCWLAGPPARGTDTAARIVRRRGGSAANVAVSICAAGGRARFFGQVGDDPLGAQLVAELERAGVEAVVGRAGATGSVVVLVEPDGERTMFPDRGAAAELRQIDEAAVVSLDALHVTAYSLLVEPIATATRTAARQAREAGVRLSLDLSSAGSIAAFGLEAFREELVALAPGLVFANAEEAELLGLEGTSHPWTTLIKHGAQPIVVLDAAGARCEVPVPAIDAVRDTTGAGDAFAAGALVALASGAATVEAVRAGSAQAARVLSQLAATYDSV